MTEGWLLSASSCSQLVAAAPAAVGPASNASIAPRIEAWVSWSRTTPCIGPKTSGPEDGPHRDLSPASLPCGQSAHLRGCVLLVISRAPERFDEMRPGT